MRERRVVRRSVHLAALGAVFSQVRCGARGGSRTRTTFRPKVFETSASAIPPPGRARRPRRSSRADYRRSPLVEVGFASPIWSEALQAGGRPRVRIAPVAESAPWRVGGDSRMDSVDLRDHADRAWSRHTGVLGLGHRRDHVLRESLGLHPDELPDHPCVVDPAGAGAQLVESGDRRDLGRCGRSEVMATYESQTARMRATSGISLAGEAARVSGAVEALVVGQDARPGRSSPKLAILARLAPFCACLRTSIELLGASSCAAR